MKSPRNISEQIIVVVLLGITFFLGFFFYKSSKVSYAEKLFDKNYVHKIEIELNEKDGIAQIENSDQKTKFHANVTIDGERFEDVSFSTRGNASLIDEKIVETERFPYKINFGRFKQGQTYYGLDKLILDNSFRDASFLKNVYSYEIMRRFNVNAALCSYTEVYLNGELKGLYVVMEEIDKSFLKRNGFLEKTEGLYKPTPLANNFLKLNQLKKELLPSENLSVVLDHSDQNFDTGGSDLKYRDDQPESYPAIFENEVIKSSPEARRRVIEAIKSLETGKNIEEYWNFDDLANFFAVHNFVVNSDSYTGLTSHNFYLALKDNKISILPWDYDSSLEGAIYPEPINLPIDNPLQGLSLEDRPLWKQLIGNYYFKEKYHNALQRLLDEYIYTDEYLYFIDKTANLIRPYVQKDPTTTHTLQDFDKTVEDIKTHSSLRADSIQKQLWGLN
ncbi:CotH kinase family protein [Candidatus Saccharibacteria bacterium]|nr:CotH kinase family protein [Candidatus Saccharibacteria bacterium]